MRARILAALFVPAIVHAQAAGVRDSIVTVSTSHITRLPADRAGFYLVVEGVAETPADAIARTQSKVTAVTDAVRRAAPQAHVDRPVEYGVGQTQNINGYPGPAQPATHTSRSVIHVETDRPDQLASLVAAALGAGASSATGVSFELTTADSVRRAHLPEALGTARADAQAVASAMQSRLGSLVDVSLNGATNTFIGSANMLSFDNRFVPQTQAPEISVTTAVTVRYRLAPR